MKLLVFDIETTGLLEEPKAVMTEIGWAIWDYEDNRIIKTRSEIVNAGNPEIPEFITNLTGITDRIVKKFGIEPREALDIFARDLNGCDAAVARNGVIFDWPFLQREAAREAFGLPERVLIDDRFDVSYPPSKANSLPYICADHGFLNPFSHSAFGDAVSLLTVLMRGGYDMKAAYESAQSPVVEVIAHVPFDRKDEAKNRKFSWNPDQKIWSRIMREASVKEVSTKEEWTFSFSKRKI